MCNWHERTQNANHRGRKVPLIRVDHGDIAMQVGQNLRKLKQAEGFSQSEAGELIVVTFQQIQKYGNGGDHLNIGRLVNYCLEFQTTPKRILGRLNYLPTAFRLRLSQAVPLRASLSSPA